DTSIADEFTRRFAEATENLALGATQNFDADVGPLASKAQLDKMGEHLRDALDKGARLVAGGEARPDLGPFFHAPTVLANVTPDMAMYGEETFGPLVAIHSFSTIDQAVELANDTDYGLNASVWSADTRLAHRIAERLQAGTVNINDGYASTWATI